MLQQKYNGAGVVQQGDCIELMKVLPNQCIHLILCDLPYGTTQCKWDSVIDTDALWEQYRRLITPDGAIVLTAVQPFTTTLILSNREWYKYEWIWVKSRASGFMNAKLKPMNRHESVLVFSPGTTANKSDRLMKYRPQDLVRIDKTRSGKRTSKNDSDGHRLCRDSHKEVMVQEFSCYPSTILEFPSVSRGIHPTQKPVELFEYLIRTYTDEGDVVMDNCSGSGTTAIAALRANRKFVCMELNMEYYTQTLSRIDKHYAETVPW